MIERPILFKGEMVRRIDDGSKTQTRRILDLHAFRRSTTPGYDWTWRGQAPVRSVAQQRRSHNCWQEVTHAQLLALCPYGVPGDLLWVRETWGMHGRGDYTWWCRDSIKGRTADDLALSYELAYAADATSEYDHWRPSIHMPRWASRYLLELVDVRIEQLHDINEQDARAEGVQKVGARWRSYDAPERESSGLRGTFPTARESFFSLWESINGTASLASNPWVWALTFKRLR